MRTSFWMWLVCSLVQWRVGLAALPSPTLRSVRYCIALPPVSTRSVSDRQ